MNMNSVLNILGILFTVAALACFVVSISRLRPRPGLHPLTFAGFGLLLAAKLCDLLGFDRGDRLLFDALVCSAFLFAMVASYTRTYFGTWKNRDTQLGGPPVA